MVHPSAFVPNGPRLVVVATLGWRNGPLLSTRSDDDDDDDDDLKEFLYKVRQKVIPYFFCFLSNGLEFRCEILHIYVALLSALHW